MKDFAVVFLIFLLTGRFSDVSSFNATPFASLERIATALHYSGGVEPSEVDGLGSFQKHLNKARKEGKSDMISNNDGKLGKSTGQSVTKLSSPSGRSVTKLSRPSNMFTATSMSEFQSEVLENSDQVVIVRFFAPWCRACKAVTPSYYKLASDLMNCDVKFVDCPMTAVNNDIRRAFDIKTIPLVHIYYEGNITEQCKISRRFYSNFEKVVKSYIDGVCSVEDGDFSSPYTIPGQETRK